MSEMPGCTPEDVERLLFGIRPRLHRFCARMLGSAIDGEDIAQEATLKALEALPKQGQIDNLEGWVFRIARNTALDFLRRRNREQLVPVGDDEDFVDPYMDTERGLHAAASLRQFMHLPPSQRAPVILMDVIGYSLEEVAEILETTVPAVKASLHRGRERLKILSVEPASSQPISLQEADKQRLHHYVDRFNARDFDALRALLAEDVRLDVNSGRHIGRHAGVYFSRYSQVHDWRLEAGIVEGLPVALAYHSDGSLGYFIVFEWREGEIARIHDFRHARYIMESVEVARLI